MDEINKKFNILSAVSIITIILLVSIIFSYVVSNKNEADQGKILVLENLPAYEELYEKSCSICHGLPDPKNIVTMERFDEMLNFAKVSSDDEIKLRDYIEYNQELN